MKESHGIKNTKEMLKLAIAIAVILKQAKENDGKININDLPLLIRLSGSFGPALDDAKLIIPELKDLDSDEAKELIAYFGQELDGKYTDKEVVRKINASIAWGLATAELVAAF